MGDAGVDKATAGSRERYAEGFRHQVPKGVVAWAISRGGCLFFAFMSLCGHKCERSSQATYSQLDAKDGAGAARNSQPETARYTSAASRCPYLAAKSGLLHEGGTQNPPREALGRGHTAFARARRKYAAFWALRRARAISGSKMSHRAAELYERQGVRAPWVRGSGGQAEARGGKLFLSSGASAAGRSAVEATPIAGRTLGGPDDAAHDAVPALLGPGRGCQNHRLQARRHNASRVHRNAEGRPRRSCRAGAESVASRAAATNIPRPAARTARGSWQRPQKSAVAALKRSWSGQGSQGRLAHTRIRETHPR